MPASANGGRMVTSPVGSARPAATAAAPVIAVVATDPRPPTSHTPTRRSAFIPLDPSHRTSVASCLSSAHRFHFMLPVKTKSVRWKAKQIFRLGAFQCFECSVWPSPLTLASACGSEARTADRRAASACWCSRRRRASGTTRSPTACARSSGSADARVSRWIRPRTRAGSPRGPRALRRRRSSSPPPARRSQNAAQQRAFERYIRAGGGYRRRPRRLRHARDWPWYERLVGARFKRHAPGTARARARGGPRRSAATKRPARRVDAHRRVVRVPTATRARHVHVLATLDETLRSPGVTATMAAARCTPRWVIRRSPTPSRALPRPPARRDRDGRRPREVRLCALSARARACVALAFAVVRWERLRAARARRRRRAPRPAQETPRQPTATPTCDAAPAHRTTARAPRSTRSRSTPGDGTIMVGSGPGAVPPRPGREGGRAHPRRARAHPRPRARSRATSCCASPARASCSRPATRRQGDAAREPAADPLERPRRHAGGRRRRGGGRLPRARDRRRPRSSPSTSSRRTSRSAATAARRGRRARRPAAPIDVVVNPDDPDHWAVSTEQGTFVSTNGGHSWRPRDTTFGARLVWPARTRSTASTATASCRVSADGGAAGRTAATSAACRAKFTVGRKRRAVRGGRRREDPQVHGWRQDVDHRAPLCADAADGCVPDE